MKFFAPVLVCLLLFEPLQGSTLSREGQTRAVNTTLKTNFNGTYQRKDPCTNTEVETSSYLASHELHHHTRDNWSDYTHKCSNIIMNFLQTIGNLIRFNHKQNGSFNFYLNTSISQKQDVSGKQESCESLPTIIIEATDCELPLDPICPLTGARNKKNRARPQKKCPAEQPTADETEPLTDFPAQRDSTTSFETRQILDQPPEVLPLGDTTPEYPLRPGGPFPPSPSANTDGPSRDAQPSFEPKPKYFKTSLRLTPQTDPENGTVQPRIQYMTANLAPPTQTGPSEPQPTPAVENPLPQPANPEIPLHQNAQQPTPMPPQQPLSPQQPAPYNSAYTSASDTTVTTVENEFSSSQPQPAQFLSNGPPAAFGPGPNYPTAPLQAPPSTPNNRQTADFASPMPQPLGLTSKPTSLNGPPPPPPQMQTPPDYPLNGQSFPQPTPPVDGESVSQSPMPAPSTPQAQPAFQQFQTQQSYPTPFPPDVPPPTNERVSFTTPQPPQMFQPQPSPNYPDRVEQPRDVSMSGSDQPSAAPYRVPSPQLSGTPPAAFPSTQPLPSPPPPSDVAPLQPTDYPLGPDYPLNPQSQPLNRSPHSFPLTDGQQTAPLRSSTTTVDQQTITFDQTTTTPAPAPQSFPDYSDMMADQPPVQPPNSLDYPPAPVPPMIPQQPPSGDFMGYPQPQPPMTTPLPFSNDDSQQLTRSNDFQVPTQNQNPVDTQVQVPSDAPQALPAPAQQQPLPAPAQQQPLQQQPSYFTTPMPFAPDMSSEQTTTETVTTTTSASTNTDYVDPALPPPLPQQAFPPQRFDFPTPPPTPQAPLPDQPTFFNRPLTPDYQNNPNQIINTGPDSFAPADLPTNAPPMPFSDSLRPPQPSPDSQYTTSVADTRNTTTVTQVTQTQSSPSMQEQPPMQFGGNPIPEQQTPGDLAPPPASYPLQSGPADFSQIPSDSLVAVTPPPDQFIPDQQQFPARFQQSFPPMGQSPPQLPSNTPLANGPNPNPQGQLENSATATEVEQLTQTSTTTAFPIQSRNDVSPVPITGNNMAQPGIPLGYPEQTPGGDQRGPIVPAQPPASDFRPDGGDPSVPYQAPPPQNLNLPPMTANQPFGFSSPPPASPDAPPASPPQDQSPVSGFNPPQPPADFLRSQLQPPAPNDQPQFPQPSTPPPPFWNDNSQQASSFTSTTTETQQSDYQTVDQTTTVPPTSQPPIETGNGAGDQPVDGQFIPPPPQPMSSFPQPAPPALSSDDFSQTRFQQTSDSLPQPQPAFPPTPDAPINNPQMPLNYNNPPFIPRTDLGQPGGQVQPVGETFPTAAQPGNFGPQVPFDSMTADGLPGPRGGNDVAGPQPYGAEGAAPPTAFNPQQQGAETFEQSAIDARQQSAGQSLPAADQQSFVPNVSPPPPPSQTTVTTYQTTTTEQSSESLTDSNQFQNPDVAVGGSPQVLPDSPPPQPNGPNPGVNAPLPSPPSFVPQSPQRSPEQRLDTSFAPPALSQVQNQNFQARNAFAPQYPPQMSPQQQPNYPFQQPPLYDNRQDLQSPVSYNNQSDFQPPQQGPAVPPAYLQPMAPPQGPVQNGPPPQNGFPARFDSLNEDGPMTAYNQPPPGQAMDYQNQFNANPNGFPSQPVPANNPPPTPLTDSPPALNLQPNPDQQQNYMQVPPADSEIRTSPVGQQATAGVADQQPSESSSSKSSAVVEEITMTESPQQSASESSLALAGANLRGPEQPNQQFNSPQISDYANGPAGYFGPPNRGPVNYNQQVDIPQQRFPPANPNAPNFDPNNPQRTDNLRMDAQDAAPDSRGLPIALNDGDIVSPRFDAPPMDLPADRQFDEPPMRGPVTGSFPDQPVPDMPGPQMNPAPYQPLQRPPTPDQAQPRNPLIETMGSHLTFPASAQQPRPFPSYPAPSPPEGNPQPATDFVNPRVDTPPQDIPNRPPQADPQVPLPDQTAPSNSGPGVPPSLALVLLAVAARRFLG